MFDTNVIVAGLVAEGLCREIVETHLSEHDAILSDALWDELVEKLRSKFNLVPEELPLLGLYRRHAEWVQPLPLPKPVCRDADDDWVLATALAGRAEMIVTGDPDLQVLAAHQGIRIVSPRQFVERIHRGSP
ncbi:MAG TPA: putative toxin-antitoxin system toxin component, PIN family [Vicinamibacteria bacterium]|nr:putative toxin-antitoxin system toxin component, PIN family [Vicinamibacteria bacterium]